MHTTRGFIIPLLLIFIALLLAGGGAYVYTQTKQVTEKDSTSSSNLGNKESYESDAKTHSDFVSVGDMLGAMTVVSVKPFNTGQYSSDPKMMLLGPQNIQTDLKGPIEVTGVYSVVHSGIGFDGYCMSVSDAKSLARLPALPVSGGAPAVRPHFCFRNEETVRQKLGETSRIATVTIDNYQLNSYPSEVVDWADLISVVRE